MKDITGKLVKMLMEGYCIPQISRISRKMSDPAATIHYNIKKLEKDKIVRAYKAVFDYKKIGKGFCVYLLVNLAPGEYSNPERIGKDLSKHPEVESIDILTGNWEMMIKVRVKDQDEYYDFVKNVISREGITKITSLTSLKQIKTEFVTI